MLLQCSSSYSNQSPSRAPRAATRGRAACVSTWLGELLKRSLIFKNRGRASPVKIHLLVSLCPATSPVARITLVGRWRVVARGDTRPARGSKLTLLSKRGEKNGQNGRRLPCDYHARMARRAQHL